VTGAAMAEVHFTSHLRNLVPDGPLSASGATVGEALANLLAAQPHVRGYVLDDQGLLRQHVCTSPMVNGCNAILRCRAASVRIPSST
jgi:hypothetical protein